MKIIKIKIKAKILKDFFVVYNTKNISSIFLFVRKYNVNKLLNILLISS